MYYKNYKAMALALGLPVKTGKSKILQMRKLALICNVRKKKGSQGLWVEPLAVPALQVPLPSKWRSNDTFRRKGTFELLLELLDNGGALPATNVQDLALRFELIDPSFFRLRLRKQSRQVEKEFVYKTTLLLHSMLTKVLQAAARRSYVSCEARYIEENGLFVPAFQLSTLEKLYATELEKLGLRRQELLWLPEARRELQEGFAKQTWEKLGLRNVKKVTSIASLASKETILEIGQGDNFGCLAEVFREKLGVVLGGFAGNGETGELAELWAEFFGAEPSKSSMFFPANPCEQSEIN